MASRIPCTMARLTGSMFVLFVIVVISFVYYPYVFFTLSPMLQNEDSFILTIILLLIFHMLLFMLLWTFTQAVFTDPGQVPPYWGFFMGDPEHKRRRYCLMCHVFKPDRCHHCSACNRCVLNMDHHCPWINNCVGFYNRKFFMLLLFYTLLTVYFVDITMALKVYHTVQYLFYDSNPSAFPSVLILSSYSICCILTVMLTLFFKFHVGLVMQNSTTIEQMEKKQPNHQVTTSYDMGVWNNWIQVFGKNGCIWFLPIFGQSGRPIGDGVVWPQRFRQQVHEEHEEVPSNEAEGRRNSALGKQNVQDVISPKQPKPNKFQSDTTQSSLSSQNAQQQSIKNNLQAFQQQQAQEQSSLKKDHLGKPKDIQNAFQQPNQQNIMQIKKNQQINQQSSTLKGSQYQNLTKKEVFQTEQLRKSGETIPSPRETPKKPDVSIEPLQNKKKSKQ